MSVYFGLLRRSYLNEPFQLWPDSTPFIQTYRLPTPLLKFQIALIAGSLLTGFLLSPLLLLSRQIARRPARRLRNPHEKLKQQRMLAGSFYGGTALVVGVIVGLWTRWCLGGRDPWKWAVLFLLEGQRRWTRPALLVYWAALGIISVAAWNRQLARSRRYRPRPTATASDTNVLLSSTGVDVTPSTDASAANTPPASATSLGISFPPLPTLPTLPNGSGVSQAATEFFDAADKHVPTLSLNARRKFFHALAVAMFLPGVAIDVSAAALHVLAGSCSFASTARICAPGAERGVRDVHIRRVHPVLCALPLRRVGARFHQRVSGHEGPRDGGA
jgi:dolichol kinase